MSDQCNCPECVGPSEPIPPEGLVDYVNGIVVIWGGDGRLVAAMHPDEAERILGTDAPTGDAT